MQFSLLAIALLAPLCNCGSYEAEAILLTADTSLNEAVDNSSVVLEESPESSAFWIAQTMESNDGFDAAQSGPIRSGQKSCLQTLARTQIEYSFNWKISAAQTHFLIFYINGEETEDIGGEQDWTPVEGLTGERNINLLKWCYEKNSDDDTGEDAGWIDQLTLERPVIQ